MRTNRFFINKSCSPLRPEAYRQRDVLSSVKISEWTDQIENIYLEQDRILQPGFMDRDPRDFISDNKLAGCERLFTYCCPSMHAALILHIAKEMVVNYRVEQKELNKVSHAIFHGLLTSYNEDISNLKLDIEKLFKTSIQDVEAIAELARELLTCQQIEKSSSNQLTAARQLIMDGHKKKITNKLVSSLVKRFLIDHACHFKLTLKSVKPVGETEDYCILGAPGDGKSTLLKQYIDEEKRTDFILIDTDNFRTVTLPGTEAHEEKNTKETYIRNQNMAMMIKKLVLDEIDCQIKDQHSRPNIAYDGFRLYEAEILLSQYQVTSVMTAFRGEPGYVGIAERVHQRAYGKDALPEDKGRFFNTTHLLTRHADVSRQLLSNAVKNHITTLYDPAVKKGKPPIKIGSINPRIHVLEINDLRVMSEFLNKRNINNDAINQIDLILSNNNSLNMLITHPENKAKSLLDLIAQTDCNPSWAIWLKEDDCVYAELIYDDGHFELTILDRSIFIHKSTADSIEGSVLRAVTRQVIEGSINASFDAVLAEGDKISFLKSLDKHDCTVHTKNKNCSGFS